MKKVFVCLLLSLICSTCEVVYTQPQPGDKFQFVTAYWPDWGVWAMPPWMIDYSAMTHIIHFSADPDASTSPYFSPVTKASDSLKLQYGNGNSARNINYQDSLIYYAHKNGVKALLCIGGIYGNSDAQMDQVCNDINKIRVYVSSISSYCKRKGYDGVDVDWEWPNNPTDYANLITVLRDTLDSWPTRGIITAAVYSMPQQNTFIPNKDLINAKVDQIMTMNYDMGNSTYAGYNAPLKPGECKFAGGNWTAWTIADHGPQNWINAGFDRNKIALGIPFYAWEFTGVDGPCQLRNGGAFYRSYANTLTYLTQFPTSKRWDDSSKVPYLSFTDGSGVKHMVSYDDSNSIPHKVNYAYNLKIGGLMVYELLGGWVQSNPVGKRDPLLQAFKKAWRGGVIQPPPVQIPVAPTLGSPGNNATNVALTATLNWSPVSNASGYTVQVSTFPNFSTVVSASVLGNSYSPTNLAYSTIYYWRVNAVNSAGTSAWSSRSFTTVPTPCFTAADTVSAHLNGYKKGSADGYLYGISKFDSVSAAAAKEAVTAYKKLIPDTVSTIVKIAVPKP